MPLYKDDEEAPRAGRGVSVHVVRPVVLDVQVEVPAFSKQMLKAVFPKRIEDCGLDLEAESWAFLPLEPTHDRFDRLNGLTLWPGLSKVVTEEEPRTKFEGAPFVLSLPVHVVNASSRPRVLPAKTVLGHVHSKPKLTGCDTYLLKDQYVEFLEGAFKFKKSEFTEVLALDTDYEETNWKGRKVWVNPPWKLYQNAVD